jgi:hypothetical protein
MDLQDNFHLIDDLDDTPAEILHLCKSRYVVNFAQAAKAVQCVQRLFVVGRGVHGVVQVPAECVASIRGKGKMYMVDEQTVLYVSDESTVENENYLAMSLLDTFMPKSCFVIDSALAKHERITELGSFTSTSVRVDKEQPVFGIVAAIGTLCKIRKIQFAGLLLEYPGFRPPVKLLVEANSRIVQSWGFPGSVDGVEELRKRLHRHFPTDLGASLYI